MVAAPGIDPVAAPGRFVAVVLLADPPPSGGSATPAPALAGQRDRAGDPITYLWAVPITEAERALAAAEGTEALVARLARAGAGWVHDPTRADAA